VYDSDLVKIAKNDFENDLTYAKIVGDNHFQVANNYVKNVTFFCKVQSPPQTQKKGAKRARVLRREDERYNNQITELRNSIEAPFGTLKEKFESLKCWREGKEQQDFLIEFGIGYLNDLKI